ncbi:MAG: glucosaminidase domain-containing protein [Bacteroidales bacterium]|nr:glucosaminidase domain-containing protein [Bacteroidales bacterium]
MMRKIIVALLCLLIGLQLSAQYTDQDIARYIDQYKELAILKMYQYKIPASITLAQGVFESACGTSRLARDGKNHFGIKCHKEWIGDTVRIDDDELQECFRKYERVEDSYNDHSLFLTSRPRYAGLFQLNVMDYKAWARGLKAAGYATNPKYADRLIDLIERFNIAQWDTLCQQRAENNWFTEENIAWAETQVAAYQVTGNRLQGTENSGQKSGERLQGTGNREQVTEENTKPQEGTSSNSGQQPTRTGVFTAEPNQYPKVKYPFTEREVYANNRCYFVIVAEGETYASIAKDVQDSEKNIRRYNDIIDKKQQAVVGEVVYIGLKAKAGKEKKHTVSAGETLRYISQKYGIQLNSIFKYNNLNENSVIHPNDIILLKH